MIAQKLMQCGLLDKDQVEELAENYPETRVDLAAIESGLVSDDRIYKLYAEWFELPFARLADLPIDANEVESAPRGVLFRHKVLPISRCEDRLKCAIGDPFDNQGLDALRNQLGCEIEPILAPASEILELLKDQFGVAGDTVDQLVADQSDDALFVDDSDDAADLAQTASVVRLVNDLLAEAVEIRASDVHLEPEEKGLSIRFRIDGILQSQPVSSNLYRLFPSMVARLKIMAKLNIAERQRPQDGRIRVRFSGREADVRVSIIPMLHGESVVLRILDQQRTAFDLSQIGIPEAMQLQFNRVVQLSHGMILVTGPTGSGKSSTLYSTLLSLKSGAKKIITVEDPIEYRIEGVSQIQVNNKVDLTFAAGLRSILRHDPDVILLGEIRDRETAESAVHAALTGHMVFSTLHTNSASGAFERLTDMGIESYLIAGCVEAVLAQRLVRVLCDCKQVDARGNTLQNVPSEMASLLEGCPIMLPQGCKKCRGTGFVGRIGLFELLVPDKQIRKLCVDNAGAASIDAYLDSGNWRSMQFDGIEKVRQGITSLDEVLRVTNTSHAERRI